MGYINPVSRALARSASVHVLLKLTALPMALYIDHTQKQFIIQVTAPTQRTFLHAETTLAMTPRVSGEQDLVGFANRILRGVCAVSEERVHVGLGTI